MMYFKRAYIIFFTLILMLGVTGCMGANNINSNQKENVREKVIRYMNDKYDCVFKYIDSVDGGLDQNNRYILVSCDNLPDKGIKVTYCNDNGIETFADNYMHLRFEKQTCNLIEELLEEVFKQDFILDYKIKGTTNSFDNTTSFEEFLESSASEIVFYAVINRDFDKAEEAELRETLNNVFKEHIPYCRGYLYFEKNSKTFESFDEFPTLELQDMVELKFETQK